MSSSYASDYKDLLGILFEKIWGRHELEINLGKLRWEFTVVPHHAERMMGGWVSVTVGRRLSHKGKTPMEEDDADASDSEQGESSHPSSRGATRSSEDAEGVGRNISDLGDGSAVFDEDTVPPQAWLTDEEWQE
ncbi:hypothetical protein AMTR_s00026p00224190 [Amborella trichopoda]|uniref:Uncharacterized protein n=1 Tax=Amborella trichopoda TaxID=13333 RepID=W1PKB9_AMBTC|nr:hypothetical protein AMTR_s00026p00224190 [Amborella trichopoda]